MKETLARYYTLYSALFWLFISAMGLSAQSLLPEAKFKEIYMNNLKGMFIQGTVSDSNKISVESVDLDFQGTNLPTHNAQDLLPGYSITGIDSNGLSHEGDLQVFSSYAWADGDYHEWVAHFYLKSLIRKYKFKKENKILASTIINIKYGENKKFKLFKINDATLEWRSSFNSFEILISKDKGNSWIRDPQLRVPNGSIRLSKLIDNFHSDVHFMLLASEQNSARPIPSYGLSPNSPESVLV